MEFMARSMARRSPLAFLLLAARSPIDMTFHIHEMYTQYMMYLMYMLAGGLAAPMFNHLCSLQDPRRKMMLILEHLCGVGSGVKGVVVAEFRQRPYPYTGTQRHAMYRHFFG